VKLAINILDNTCGLLYDVFRNSVTISCRSTLLKEKEQAIMNQLLSNLLSLLSNLSEEALIHLIGMIIIFFASVSRNRLILAILRIVVEFFTSFLKRRTILTDSDEFKCNTSKNKKIENLAKPKGGRIYSIQMMGNKTNDSPVISYTILDGNKLIRADKPKFTHEQIVMDIQLHGNELSKISILKVNSNQIIINPYRNDINP